MVGNLLVSVWNFLSLDSEKVDIWKNPWKKNDGNGIWKMLS